MVFAWFTIENELKIYQEIVVGEFLIELNVNSKLTGDSYTGKDISLSNTFPMTREDAETRTDNAFLAKIKNNGNISAMFRYKITITSGAVYSDYYNFSVYIKNSGVLDAENHTNADLTYAASGKFSQINEILANVTCLDNSYTEYGLIEGRTNLTEGESKYIKLYVWLDENIKIGDTGTDSNTGFGNENLAFSFKVTVEAIQSSGTTWIDFNLDSSV